MKKVVVFLMAAVAGFGVYTATVHGEKSSSFSPYVTRDGKIMLPKDYRDKWVHLGSWAVSEKGAPGQGFHDVYTQHATVETYRKTGTFPDGACLVKEIRAVKSDKLTTGKAEWAGDMKMWFVMIKDAKGRFKSNPNWGEGWGWGLFKADDRGTNVSMDFKKDCIGCHLPVKKTDWVYVFGYPTLR